MKKINELKSERAELVTKMEALVNGEEMTEEQRSEWSVFETDINKIDADIKLLERQEELNKNKIIPMKENTEKKSVAVEFRDWLTEAVNKGQTTSFRADPVITSTDADLIQKSVLGIDVMVTPGEEFLRELGVTFYTGLTGTLALPSMDEDLATFPGEDASAASANMLPDSVVLAARRVTHTQSITRETLAQTSPQVYASILQALVDGIGKAMVYDVFDQVDADAATQISTMGATLTYADMVNCEASVGGLGISKGAYVTSPTGKAFLKKTIELGTTVGPAIWKDNEINGYPAFGTAGANANKVYFGDWSKAAVGIWGSGVEIIVDPYSQAKQGRIALTVVALMDSGVQNKRAFCIKDGSLA